MTDVDAAVKVGLVIDGSEVAGEDGTYPVLNPVRPDEIVFAAPRASLAQLDTAVAAARRAQPAWAALGMEERAAVMRDAAAGASKIADPETTARLLTREHGKILAESYFDSGTPGGMIDAFYGLAQTAVDSRKLESGARRTEIRHEPHGVVAALLPYNWPVAVLGNKAIPALLTGNAVVAKAPPGCPGAVLMWSAAFAAGLPAGLLNVLAGPDAALGEALVTHPGVDMVSFTGGVTTGQAVMRAASSAVRPVVLELGGNDPAIIAPDVEVDDQLARRILDATFVTSGQVCMAIKRLYVPRAKVGAFVEALNAGLASAVVGDGLEPEVTMGPGPPPGGPRLRRAAARRGVGSRRARPQARNHPCRGRRSGGLHRVAHDRGGPAARHGHRPRGAIRAGAARDRLRRHLGCGRCGQRHRLRALRIDLERGRGARCESRAARLEAGTVFVNQHGMSAIDYRAPMGGWKRSGYGLELGVEGMQAFTRTQGGALRGALAPELAPELAPRAGASRRPNIGP